MNFITFTKSGRTLLLLTAVAAVLGLTGCGDDNGANSGGANETVKIGGVKWTKKNLSVKTEYGSYCYGDSRDVSTTNTEECDKYGRLYNWAAAVSACQSIGMRLPSTDDWVHLVESVGGVGSTWSSAGTRLQTWSGAGKKLKSKSGWNGKGNGTDDFGFSALPGGSCGYTGGCDEAGEGGYWWTSAAEEKDNNGYRFHRGWGMHYDDDDAHEGGTGGSNFRSVRCIKD